jgi:nucleoid DNA-binding protein
MDTATLADVARRAGLTIIQGRRFVRAILGELSVGRRVRFQGFGEFRTTILPRRTVRTPIIPGGVAVQPERRTIRFRVFRSASRRMNEE